jgi:hypothetical protein
MATSLRHGFATMKKVSGRPQTGCCNSVMVGKSARGAALQDKGELWEKSAAGLCESHARASAGYFSICFIILRPSSKLAGVAPRADWCSRAFVDE